MILNHGCTEESLKGTLKKTLTEGHYHAWVIDIYGLLL